MTHGRVMTLKIGSEQSEPEPTRRYAGVDKPKVRIIRNEPKDWPGKLYPTYELVRMGEGDRQTYSDADWYGKEPRVSQDNQ